jgi:diguanylate cyclase
MTRRVSFHVVLVWALWLVVAAYVAALALHGVGAGPNWKGAYSTAVNNWVWLATDWLPAAVCWLAVSRVRSRCPEVLFAAAAVTSYALGDTYYTAVQTMTGSVPFPSLGDVAYLGFNLLMMAALVAAVRRHVRGLVALSVWLDAAVGSLGAAAVLAVVLRPVLDSDTAGPLSLATAVAVAYPMLDMVLVATIAGIAAVRDVRVGGGWALLILGLLAYAATDVVYGLQATAGTYVVGTPLDAGWALGLALMATWVDGAAQPERPVRKKTRAVSGARALGVSAVATVAGLGVLLTTTRVPLSALAVTLAGVTLLAAAVRSQLAFRRLAQMADLRRLTAATDELTGLANRRALYAEGAALVEPGRRRHALLMLDLDKFKEVNDSLGHRAGDQLLVQVGARLREHLPHGAVLARLGGDEFAVLLDDAGYDEATDVAAKLRAAVGEPFALEHIALHTSVSVGVALFPDDGRDLSTLLRKADIAMYQAKTSLQGQHVYCDADDANDTTRLQTVEELHTALGAGQLVVHYQPKVDLDTGEVHAVEALVRWEHPARGLVYPDAFLYLVEESGLMPTLTQVVLAQALDQVKLWQAQGQQLVVAVNLSASSLVDYDLPRQVASMLAARGVSPHALQLEITEEFLMHDHDRARSILTRLRSSGVQISVDDYGTGYSSLSYLRDLPIDELKLDRSFMLPMLDDARAVALVASTIAMAHSLGLRMVAEGVETGAAYAELARLGCDQAQGYYMSRPVPAAELDHWLRSRRALV